MVCSFLLLLVFFQYNLNAAEGYHRDYHLEGYGLAATDAYVSDLVVIDGTNITGGQTGSFKKRKPLSKKERKAASDRWVHLLPFQFKPQNKSHAVMTPLSNEVFTETAREFEARLAEIEAEERKRQENAAARIAERKSAADAANAYEDTEVNEKSERETSKLFRYRSGSSSAKE